MLTRPINVFKYWRELLNSDSTVYGGSGMGNGGGVNADSLATYGEPVGSPLFLD